MISTIIRAHNEEKYIAGAIGSAILGGTDELIIILDRCTDKTASIVERKLFTDLVDMYPKKMSIKVIKKDVVGWKFSTAENLDLGIHNSSGDIIAVHDADIMLGTSNFLKEMEKYLNDPVVSVNCKLVIDKYVSFMNFIYHYWEKTRDIIFPKEESRGGVRLMRRSVIDQFGIADTSFWDTKLDMDLRSFGFLSETVPNIVCYDRRKFSFKRAIKSQIRYGEDHRKLRSSIPRMLVHSIIRSRPFVVYGYVKELLKEIFNK